MAEFQLRDIWATGGTAVLESVSAQASSEFIRLIIVTYLTI